MIQIGNLVTKKSGKPFKSGKSIERVVNFGINIDDPKGRKSGVFEDGSMCNLDMMVRVNPVPGDRVKMTETFKYSLSMNESSEHIEEFGECEGIVEVGEGPEVNVRWEPSGLRYSYDPSCDIVQV